MQIETRTMPQVADAGDLETVRLARSGGVLWIDLNRAHVANAFNTRMAEELEAVFSDLYRTVHTQDIRAIVLSGGNCRSFCGGADLKERRDFGPSDWHRQHAIFEQMGRAIFLCPIPIIGAINGAAYGGGAELALLCDFALAASTATFSFPEVSRGIIPGVMGTQLLAEAIGQRRARQLIFTGETFSAAEAHAWGMVNQLHAPDDLRPAAADLAEAMCRNAPMAVRSAKKAIRMAGEVGLSAGYQFEIETYSRNIGSEDQREGVLAFNEKRQPLFTGR